MRCAVIGSPIAHSLSPAMHRAAYVELGLDWTYDAVDVAEGALTGFLGALGDDVRGFSVTAPLKREAAQAAHQRSEHVELLSVANTLVIDDGMLSAYNTDVPGATAALAELGIESVSSARILGGGATAASLAFALATLGAQHVELVVRDFSRAADAVAVAESSGLSVAVHTVDKQLLGKVDLLVSTVPAEAVGSRARELVDAAHAVFDVVYDPWPTTLALAAEAGGIPVVTGIDLLAHQAALQVELMTGEPISPQLLREVALADLAAR